MLLQEEGSYAFSGYIFTQRPWGWGELVAYFRVCRGPSSESCWASKATPSSPRELSDRLEKREKRLVESEVGSVLVVVWSPAVLGMGTQSKQQAISLHFHIWDTSLCQGFSKICGVLGARDNCEGYQSGMYVWKESNFPPPPGHCRVSDVRGERKLRFRLFKTKQGT